MFYLLKGYYKHIRGVGDCNCLKADIQDIRAKGLLVQDMGRLSPKPLDPTPPDPFVFRQPSRTGLIDGSGISGVYLQVHEWRYHGISLYLIHGVYNVVELGSLLGSLPINVDKNKVPTPQEYVKL